MVSSPNLVPRKWQQRSRAGPWWSYPCWARNDYLLKTLTGDPVSRVGLSGNMVQGYTGLDSSPEAKRSWWGWYTSSCAHTHVYRLCIPIMYGIMYHLWRRNHSHRTTNLTKLLSFYFSNYNRNIWLLQGGKIRKHKKYKVENNPITKGNIRHFASGHSGLCTWQIESSLFCFSILESYPMYCFIYVKDELLTYFKLRTHFEHFPVFPHI